MLDRLVGICLSLLVAAVAVYAAVKLIEAVWAALLAILANGSHGNAREECCKLVKLLALPTIRRMVVALGTLNLNAHENP